MAATKRERHRFFGAWTRFLTYYFPGVPNDLRSNSRPEQLALMAAFAKFVRDGGVSSRKHQVRTQTVQVALRALATTWELEGKPNLLADAQGHYPKAIKLLLSRFKQEDPPIQAKLAVPVTVPNYLCLKGIKGTERDKTVGDLALIAFYFLLRVGEYTYHKPSENRRTKQFRIQDITLWNGTISLDPNKPLKELYTTCTAATLKISNQKNGKRDQVIHQESTNSFYCPIKALIRRITYIKSHTSDTTKVISTYFTNKSTGFIPPASAINTAVKTAVTELHLHQHGLHNHHVGSHSLRAGGAMAMHLNGINPLTIKKMGRWSSDTFLMYIHEQISAFSKGVSTSMAQPIQFHNIAYQPAAGPTLQRAVAA